MQVRLHGAAQRPSYKKLVHWWIVEVSRVGTISKQVRRIVMVVEGAGPRGTGLALPGLCTAPGEGWLQVYLLAGVAGWGRMMVTRHHRDGSVHFCLDQMVAWQPSSLLLR